MSYDCEHCGIRHTVSDTPWQWTGGIHYNVQMEHWLRVALAENKQLKETNRSLREYYNPSLNNPMGCADCVNESEMRQTVCPYCGDRYTES